MCHPACACPTTGLCATSMIIARYHCSTMCSQGTLNALKNPCELYVCGLVRLCIQLVCSLIPPQLHVQVNQLFPQQTQRLRNGKKQKTMHGSGGGVHVGDVDSGVSVPILPHEQEDEASAPLRMTRGNYPDLKCQVSHLYCCCKLCCRYIFPKEKTLHRVP